MKKIFSLAIFYILINCSINPLMCMEKDSETIAENNRFDDEYDIEEFYRRKEHLEEEISKKCDLLKYSIKDQGLELVEELQKILKSYNRLQYTIKSQNPSYEIVSTEFEEKFTQEQHERILRTINMSNYAYCTAYPTKWEYDKKYENTDWLSTLDTKLAKLTMNRSTLQKSFNKENTEG